MQDSKRASSAERGYSTRWANYSRRYRRANPLCVDCLSRGILSNVEGKRGCVDHIVPHKGDHKLFWDPKNHQSLCNSCHSRKTAQEDGGFGNKGGKASAACGVDGVPVDGRHHWRMG